MMKTSKNITFIFAIMIGLLLMISPSSFTRLIVLIVSGLLIIGGVWTIVAILKDKDQSRGTLISGIVRVLIGIYAASHPGRVLSIIPILLGVLLIAEGATGLQLSVGNGKYMNIAIIVIGGILLLNPLGSLHSAVFWSGVMLAGYGVLGLLKINFLDSNY